MTNPTLVTTPFAENGDKNIIPESVGANPQNATMQAGFPPITQQKISEGGIPPERNDFNGILNLYGQHIVHLNKGLPYEFDQSFANAIGGYPLNARLMLSNGDIVRSTVANNVNNPNSDMTGWVKINAASQIVDESGLSQQEINDLFASEGVNILSVYGGINDFGVAIELAHTKMINSGFSTIFIPDGTYTSKTSANLTLEKATRFVFGSGVVINAEKKVDIFNIEQQDKYLHIDGNGCYAYAQWGVDNTIPQNAIFKLSSSTLSRSCFIDNFNTEQVDGRHFWFGVNGVGLNYSLFKECLLQTHMPIWNESRATGYGHAMGSIVKDCYLHAMADGTCVTLVNNGALGCEGWSLEGGEFFCKTAVQVLDNLNVTGYYSPLLRITNVHMNCVRAARLEGVGRVQVSGCDIQTQIEENNPFSGVFELLGVQSLVIGGGTTVSQAPTTGAAPQDGIPLISVLDHPTGKVSALVNISNDTNLWLYQDKALIEFQSDACYAGQLYFDAKAFTAKIVDAEFAGKVHLPESTNIQNWDAALNTTFSGDATFNPTTGVLVLNTAPSVGNVYQVGSDKIPQWSTIKQIITNNSIGKKYSLIIDSNVTIEHNANLYTPSASHVEVLNAPTTLELFSYNSNLSRIVNISSNTSFLKSSKPTSSASWGLHGMRILDGGFVYEYFVGTGWVRYAASTF